MQVPFFSTTLMGNWQSRLAIKETMDPVRVRSKVFTIINQDNKMYLLSGFKFHLGEKNVISFFSRNENK